jgi:hypothetical protein
MYTVPYTIACCSLCALASTDVVSLFDTATLYMTHECLQPAQPAQPKPLHPLVFRRLTPDSVSEYCILVNIALPLHVAPALLFVCYHYCYCLV